MSASLAALAALTAPDRATWRDAHDHAACCHRPDAVAVAWRVVADVVEARARVARHQQVTRHLVIRANPADYDRIVGDLAGMLAKEFRDLSRPVVDALMRDLVAIGSSGRATAMNEAEAAMQAAAAKLGITGRTSKKRVDAFIRATGAAYMLGQQQIAGTLGWSLSTDLPDRDAIAGLSQTGLLWIGDAYGDRLDQRRILAVVEKTMIRGGLGREEGGKALAAEFTDQYRRSDAYWEMLAATAATRARSAGSLAAMERCGVVTYEFMNPLDERTSDVCRALDGTIYKVKTSLALRDRMLTATSPDEYKAIAPWPRGADVYTAEGAAVYRSGALHLPDGTLDTAKAKPYLRPSGELAASGIAFPPLHGHCRSSIEADAIEDLDSDGTDPIGDVEPERTEPPPPPPKKPRTKKADTPTTTADDWTLRRRAWKDAEKAVKARGLDVADVAPSERVLTDLRTLTHAYGRRGVTLPRGTFDYSEVTRAGKVRPLSPGRERWRKLLDELEAGPAAGEAAVAALRADLEALDDFERTYCDAMRAAPRDVHEAECKRWAAVINDRSIDRDIPKDKAEEIRAALVDTIATSYGADTLSILAREGVRLRNQSSRVLGERPRAYAHPGRTYAGVPPSAHVPKRYALEAGRGEYSTRATTVHELAHTLDIVLGSGRFGKPWAARPGLPDAPATWRRAFGEPFERAKSGLGPMVLPNERNSRYYHAGNWIEPYEARIYTGHARIPSAAEQADGGPVEFIAMAGSYHRHQVEQVRNVLASGEIIMADLPITTLANTRWVQARAAYGDGYGEGFEALTGQPLLREVARRMTATDAPTFRTPRDAIAMSLLISDTGGIPVDRLVGPGGPLETAVGALRPPPDVWAHWKTRLDGAQAAGGLWQRRHELRQIIDEILGAT